ncbi:MAG TPA: SIS domain-containing protein [Arachnia sp.]|nr:SIS domain-containing protein [Arachnia sp.]HMT86057.1 SIS domain-containing protein [Arachnia sp.]
MRRLLCDDARLEDPLLVDNERLRWLAGTGARIRRAALNEPVGQLSRADRPRGVLVIGSEARLVRAVLEPSCPVPFMAWPGPGLPAWVGPLDLVVVLGHRQSPAWVVQCAAEALRRGATMIVAAPEGCELSAATASPSTTVVPTDNSDPMAAAIAVLALLGALGLGPEVRPEHVADAADLVAEACSPAADLSVNPGKDLALGLAERLPLIWGGTTLAARASRRIAEAVRRASGVPALAADDSELDTLLRAVQPKDLFADPGESDQLEPVLVLIDDALLPAPLTDTATRLSRLADAVDVRVVRISSGDAEIETTDLERYVTVLQHGYYGAAYLEIALTPAEEAR